LGAGSPPKYDVSYDPIKTKLLFHENTTLRGVLEDIVANMQKLLHNYFSVQSIENPDDDVLVWNVDGVVHTNCWSFAGQISFVHFGCSQRYCTQTWPQRNLLNPDFWKLGHDDTWNPPFRLRCFDAPTHRGTITFGTPVAEYDKVQLSSLNLPRTCSLQVRRV